MTNDHIRLQQAVEQAFHRASMESIPSRWKACSVIAGCAAVQMAMDGNAFLAACMEGVAEEARRRMLALLPEGVPA